jgi:hypothetical protein
MDGQPGVKPMGQDLSTEEFSFQHSHINNKSVWQNDDAKSL